MTDDGKQPNQAVGGKSDAGGPDGVNTTSGGGESGGGAYPNPHDDKDAGRFAGGQSEKDYHGGPGGAHNDAAGTDTSDAD
ncbi:hypothetical protein ASE65_07815 [Sphingomonas sp. Leaf16]|nr:MULTISPECIES: hypothetical protein [unclassified Sphingomonas]KQM61431.1 hypothetical protein ASE65_07815 [Sphingomonas sp. Leaf16]KQN12526.1 hypothetical protein ASE81_08825 [Sphingomonas sp. Leaf29]KQN19006.1 hypothetical protein ASE83_08750 [Sphingomonas sp. Leaf32]